MKKTLTLLSLAMLMLVSLSACSNDDDVKIDASELPVLAQNFIDTYFTGNKIKHITKDTDSDGLTYEVALTGGYEIEFDAVGHWKDVDAPRNKTIPSGIAPEAIETYVAINYPLNGMNEITRSYSGYEVELINGVSLYFNQLGEFQYADND